MSPFRVWFIMRFGSLSNQRIVWVDAQLRKPEVMPIYERRV